MTQESLFNVREAARATDPVTSVMAAERVAPHVHAGQMRALSAFYLCRHRSLDDFELSELTRTKQTSIGKRRGELERMGYVERADRRASSSALTSSIVQSYRITAAGREFYEKSR